MKIENKTSWDTKDIKKLFNFISKKEGITPYKIIIKYARDGIYIMTGRAWCNSRVIEMFLQNKERVYNDNKFTGIKELQILESDNIRNITSTYIHELAHLRGVQHKEMKITIDEGLKNQIKNFTIKRKVIKQKPKTDLQVKRYENVQRHIKDKQIKIKRLTNSLKKWKQKQKYYEKTLIAAGKMYTKPKKILKIKDKNEDFFYSETHKANQEVE